MPRLVHGLLLAILVSVGNLSAAQKGEELALFRKYYSSARSAAERKEAVLTLDGVEDPGVFAVLYPRLADPAVEPEVGDAIVSVLSASASEARQKQVFDALKAEKGDEGKLGLLRVVAQGKWKDRGGILALQLAGKSWEVRRRALEALVAGGDPELAQKLAPLCDDAQDVLRFKALDALASLGSALVLPKAIARLEDPSRQVRQSAIRALGLVRDKSAVAPLVQRMAKEEGVLLLDFAEALSGLTGRDFGTEPLRWAQWWSEQDPQTYDIPTVEGVAYLRGHRSARSGEGGWGPDTHPGGKVFPITTPSRRMVFVIDCSGSMEALVTEKERYEGEKYPDLSRMEIVKTELVREIERLPSSARFNIIAFATDVNPWKPGLQPANIMVKFAAKEWIKGLHAIGGASKEEFALHGLPGAAGLEKGRTNAFDALRVALGVDGLRTADATYAKVEADTIFFLSDGRPTAGAYVEPEDVLREIRRLNELRKVVIHTIGIGEFDASFMKRLAEQNGPGQFVDLGK